MATRYWAKHREYPTSTFPTCSYLLKHPIVYDEMITWLLQKSRASERWASPTTAVGHSLRLVKISKRRDDSAGHFGDALDVPIP